MDREEARGAVRLAVQAELSHRGWNITQLKEASGIDHGTIADFLAGQRWPQIKTLGAIEKALSWPAGTVAAMLAGQPAPPVGGVGEDPGLHETEENTLLYRRPDGLSDEEWNRVRRESREFIEWQIEKASRER